MKLVLPVCCTNDTGKRFIYFYVSYVALFRCYGRPRACNNTPFYWADYWRAVDKTQIVINYRILMQGLLLGGEKASAVLNKYK